LYTYVVLLCTALYSTPLYPGLPGVSNLGVYVKKTTSSVGREAEKKLCCMACGGKLEVGGVPT
jgi:hypothetical protein